MLVILVLQAVLVILVLQVLQAVLVTLVLQAVLVIISIDNIGIAGNVDHLSSIEVVGCEECLPQVVSHGDIMLQVGHMTAKGEVAGHLDWTGRIREAGKLRLKLKKLRTYHDNFLGSYYNAVLN